jgi:hypothetical protein
VKNAIIFVILVAAAAYGGTKWHMHNKVGNSVDIAILMMSPFAEVTYEGVSSTLSGELTVDGVRVRLDGFNDELLIDRIGIDTPSFLSLLKLTDITENPLAAVGDMPRYFGFIAEGIHLPANADYYHEFYNLGLEEMGVEDGHDPGAECVGKYGFSPRALAGLGYSEQVVSASLIFRQDGSRFVVDIDSSADDMWDAGIEMTLAGDMITEFSKGSRARPRMANLRVEYNDHSLRDRVRRYCSSLGLSDEEIFAAQMDAFHYMGEMNGIEFDEYMIEPFEDFLRGKSTLVITAKPSEPVSLSQIKLYKPSDVPALLDLTAQAM